MIPFQNASKLSPSRRMSLLLLGLFLLCVYLLTASRQYDADVLGELRIINSLNPASPDPAHMLYVRIGVPFYRLWQAAGYGGDALWPMQVLNGFFGAGTIVMLALVLRRLASQWSIIILICISAGLSYAFWTHVVDAFFIIPAAFFSMFALLCAVELSVSHSWQRRIILAVGLGAGVALASLTYQTNLALIPALVAASWSEKHGSVYGHVKTWLLIMVVIILIAGGAWLFQGMYSAQVQSVQGLFTWFLFGHGGMGHGLWRREGINLFSTIPIAWLATVLPVYEGLRLKALSDGIIVANRIPAQIALVVLVATLVWVVLKTATDRARNLRTPNLGRAAVVCFLWLAVPGLAVAWFDPAEVKLWLVPMFAMWIFGAVMLSSFISTASSKSGTVWLNYGLAASLALTIPLANFVVPVWPNHIQPSEKLSLAREAAKHMKPEDMLVSAGFDWSSHLRYISDEFQVVNAISIAQTFGKPAVRPRLWQEIEGTWATGAHVYIMDYFSPGKEQVWTDWITPFAQLTEKDFEGIPRTVAWQIDTEIVWELLPPE